MLVLLPELAAGAEFLRDSSEMGPSRLSRAALGVMEIYGADVQALHGGKYLVPRTGGNQQSTALAIRFYQVNVVRVGFSYRALGWYPHGSWMHTG